MAKRHFRGFHAQVGIALVLGCLVVPLGRAQDAERKAVLKLDLVTGKDSVAALPKTMPPDAPATKKLLAEAVKMAREKDQPLSYNAAVILGQVAGDANEFADAEVFYRIAMKKAAKLQSQAMLAESYGGLIGLFYDGRKYADAIRICEELLKLKTDDGKERIVRLAFTDAAGETDYIEFDAFDTAKLLRPRVKRILVQALAKQRKYDEALKIVDEMLKDQMLKDQNQYPNLELKGRVLHEAGRYEDAVKVFETILDKVAKDKNLSAEDKEELLEGYKYNVASILIDMNKIDEAAAILEKLIAANPKNPSYYNDLGYIWADKNVRLGEAEKLIRKALELDREIRAANKESADNDNGTYLDSLGWVLFRQKRYREAREVLQKALEDKNAQHIEIYDHLADTCLAMGDVEAARAAWRKGLDVATESRRDQELKRAVEKKLQEHKK